MAELKHMEKSSVELKIVTIGACGAEPASRQTTKQKFNTKDDVLHSFCFKESMLTYSSSKVISSGVFDKNAFPYFL